MSILNTSMHRLVGRYLRQRHYKIFPLSSVTASSINTSQMHLKKCVRRISAIKFNKKPADTSNSAKSPSSISDIIEAIPYKPMKFDKKQTGWVGKEDVGAELGGPVNKEAMRKLLNEFCFDESVLALTMESGLDSTIRRKCLHSFYRFCQESDVLPPELHLVLTDLLQGSGHISDLFPMFLRHAREIFPHLTCADELSRISDLRLPANWYPEARSIQRKIIYHAGPTNSGKTHQALDRFFKASSGVYCGPLKLLASEVFHKAENAGTPCDMITGEERRLVDPEGQPAAHLACTVEMTHLINRYEVAVIDEIQMIRDPQRGWAWTRALLGVCADEVHVCGEATAVDLVKELVKEVGDTFTVHNYNRLTPLNVQHHSLRSNFERIRPGDCIVCFAKADIYKCLMELEKLGHEVAVIYGSLPPSTKLAQAAKFNDPNHPCKILVATDAIGMGLNLSIKRIVFFSIRKSGTNASGEFEYEFLTTSQALQIAGRAGRFKTNYDIGEVTTFTSDHLPVLRRRLNAPNPQIVQAGIQPTPELMELLSFHIPNASLSQLVSIFSLICRLDALRYFLCPMEDFKFFADKIQHLALPMKARYVFCCAPINRKSTFVCAMFVKLAHYYSENMPVTQSLIANTIGWPLEPASTLLQLNHLEEVFDVLDLYLWLGYRFPEIFPDSEDVRAMQQELDQLINDAVESINDLLVATTEITTQPDRGDRVTSTHEQADRRTDSAEVKGSLSERLLNSGTLDRDTFEQLRKEILQGEKANGKD